MTAIYNASVSAAPIATARWKVRLQEGVGFGLLTLPAVLMLSLFFFFPIMLILGQSIFDPTFTLDNFQQLFSDDGYLRIVFNSLKIAFFSTLISAALAYPVAYALVMASPVRRSMMMMVVLLPFWTNILIRCYAWMLLLQSNGIVNSLLVGQTGLVDHPLPLVFNLSGVLIGMVHYLVPMNILILYSSMRSVDLRLLHAAQGLGANPLRAFWSIFMPLTLPGVQSAAILIFIVSLGFYVTPVLLGGRGETTISVLVSTYFTDVLDWGFGSALATLLLIMTLAGLAAYYSIKRLEPKGVVR